MTPFASGLARPAAWTLLMLGACVLLLVFGHGLGLRWDPLGWSERRSRALQQRVEAAEAFAAARDLEAEGRAEQQRRLDLHHRQATSVATLTERAATHARIAHDAETPLDPARLDRLREHDRGLCDAAPDVCGASEAASAADSDQALSPGPAG